MLPRKKECIMLGKLVKVHVTEPVNSFDKTRGIYYRHNFGYISIQNSRRLVKLRACVMGMNRPVRRFDGRVIAMVTHADRRLNYAVVAPDRARYINIDVQAVVSQYEPDDTYRLRCYYENSCGAIIIRKTRNTYNCLLIKNRLSENWGFPKGHMELGENEHDTARREALEETGLHIDFIPGFKSVSRYRIAAGKIDKRVTIFLAASHDVEVNIQPSEISDFMWLTFDEAEKLLRFKNDKQIIREAADYIKRLQ